MNNKWAPFILILVLGLLLFVIKRCQAKNEPAPKPKVTNNDRSKDPAANVNRDRGFDRRVSYLEYSKHAKCRMECRHISMAEVEDIMRNGNINYNKSDLQASAGPKYALEGYTTKDRQHIRVIVAPKQKHLSIVTVIDLDKDWECPSCK